MKNQYLTEAGLQESLAQQINQVLPENLGYKEFAQAVADILKDEYGSHNFDPFMEVLHAELGMKESLNEVESSNIERIDFSFVDGTTKFYGAYIYNKGSKRWDEKLSSSEKVQDFLTSLGIDIEFDYYNLPEIFKALKAQGIEAEDSEFDVS
jgi:hypothetical protein